MLVKPKIWANTWGEVPTKLHMVVIELRAANPLSKPYHPIAFLTRTEMPKFPTFPVYLDNDIETTVGFNVVPAPLHPTGTLLNQLVVFTFRIFEDCFNKFYEKDASKMSYWLAPVKLNWQNQSAKHPINILDQSILSQVAQDVGKPYTDPNEVPIECILSKLLVDSNSGKYRYFPVRIEPKLRADSPVPEHMPPRRKAMDSILNYSLSLWGGARTKFLDNANPGQPVLKTELVPIRRNYLDRRSQAEKDVVTEIYVCPQPLKVSAVSISH